MRRPPDPAPAPAKQRAGERPSQPCPTLLGQTRCCATALLAVVGLSVLIAGSLARAQDEPTEIAGMQAIRGSVVKVAGGTYTVKTSQGVLYKVATGANTHFISGEQASEAEAIRVGATVLAGGELDEKQHTLGAVFLAAVDAEQLAEFDRRRAEFGKTWLAGTVVAKHGTELVIKRPDDVTTTVNVGENTSFRKQHESITLGDIQVGDGLTARGSMQKGIFAGTLLTVVDADEIRQWAKLRDR